MNVVNQDFNDRLAVLKVCFPRTDGIAKRALDDRVHGFGFPALSEETIQTGGDDHIGSGFSLRINRFAMSSNRRNDVWRTPILGVKAASAGISQVRRLVSLCVPKWGALVSKRSNKIGHCSVHLPIARRAWTDVPSQLHKRL